MRISALGVEGKSLILFFLSSSVCGLIYIVRVIKGCEKNVCAGGGVCKDK